MQHLAAGPPEIVPGFAHCLTWIDNYLQYLNMTEERKQRTGAGEKHATVIGYAVPRAEAARVPAWPACIPQWNALPVGTVLSWTKPCFICREPNSIWSGVTVSELRAGAHLCSSSSQAGPSSQTGPSSQYGLSAAALAQATDRLASDATVGDYALMDGADDREYGDGAKVDGRELRYYLIKIRGVRRALTAPEPSDWGLLDTGTQVVDAEYYFLCYRPGNPARWYVAAQPAPRLVTVPTHLLLRVGFRMQLAQLGRTPSKQQRQHVQRNAIVLPIEEHQAAVAELQRRRGRS